MEYLANDLLPTSIMERLPDIIPSILYTASRLAHLHKFETLLGRRKEAEWRSPVDTFLDVVLCNSPPEGYDLRMEVPICLPQSTAQDIHVGDATMDIGYFSYHPDITNKIPQSQNRDHLPRNLSVMPTYTLNHALILHLPCEYKRDEQDVKHSQAVYDLSAAQNQLRVLGIKDQIIYGIGCIKGVADIMWSRWEDPDGRFDDI
ncbi:hypothetical protein FRB94_000087 [Tulasnella sp. JGI-2019a]|nr:hypothetical protein FRB94_000087 [Tulasnella sp. JGI-2019a]